MGQVSIDINGRSYAVACDDGEEDHIARLGRELATRVEQLSDTVGQVGDARLLVMAGLLLADELNNLRDASGGGEGADAQAGKLGELTAALEALADRAELVADTAERT